MNVTSLQHSAPYLSPHFERMTKKDEVVGIPPSFPSALLRRMDSAHFQQSMKTTSKPVFTRTSLSDEVLIPQRFTKNGRRRAIPFPLKLMQLLSNREYNHIITWMPDGKSFVIIRPKAFVSEVLPKYFKSTKYASFTRKLHRWGFERVDDGAGEFFHKSFLKGRVDLAERMVCLNNVGLSSSSKTSNFEETRHLRDSTKSLFTSAPRLGMDVFPSVSLGKGRESPTSASGLDGEAMRLRECIRAASVSRNALSHMTPSVTTSCSTTQGQQSAMLFREERLMQFALQSRYMELLKAKQDESILTTLRAWQLRQNIHQPMETPVSAMATARARIQASRSA